MASLEEPGRGAGKSNAFGACDTAMLFYNGFGK